MNKLCMVLTLGLMLLLGACASTETRVAEARELAESQATESSNTTAIVCVEIEAAGILRMFQAAGSYRIMAFPKSIDPTVQDVGQMLNDCFAIQSDLQAALEFVRSVPNAPQE